MRRVWVVVAMAAVGLLAGCGEADSSPEDQARAVGERFAHAIDRNDYATICADLFSDDYAEALSAPEIDIECADLGGEGALGNPGLKGLVVSAVSTEGPSATIRFEGSQAYLTLAKDDSGEWRIAKLDESG